MHWGEVCEQSFGQSFGRLGIRLCMRCGTLFSMENDDRDPPAEREKQVNEKPTIGRPGPHGRSPYDDKGNYHEELTYEIER
jgi:hypothetical protein